MPDAVRALDLAGFIDATTVYGLPIVSFTSATGEFAFGFQLGPALLPFAGVAFHFQAVVQNPTTPGFRWTNLSTVILVP